MSDTLFKLVSLECFCYQS